MRPFLSAVVGVVIAVSPALSQEPGKDRIGRPYLGVQLGPTTASDAKGVLVLGVDRSSPAEKAGLRPGDRITRTDGTALTEPDDLVAKIAKLQPGDSVALGVNRNGKELDVKVTLAQRTSSRPFDFPLESDVPYLGVVARQLTPELEKSLGVTVDRGAVVTEVLPGTAAAKAGIEQNDVITAFDGRPVAGPADLRFAVARTHVGEQVALTIARGKETKELTARLQESPVDGLNVFPFPLPGGLRGGVSAVLQALDRVEELQRRIEALEKRVQELEKRQSSK